MQLIGAGVLYFALTTLAGFMFGALRQTFVVPRLGQLTATLIETPLMLAVSYFAARCVIGRFSPLPGQGARLAIGLVAFALLMTAEIVLSGVVRGWSIGQWFDHMKTPEGGLSMAIFGIFAILPLIVRRG